MIANRPAPRSTTSRPAPGKARLQPPVRAAVKHGPIRPIIKPAAPLRRSITAAPEPPQAQAEPAEPLSMLAIMEDSARALHELATIASRRLKDKLAVAAETDDLDEATSLLSECLRLRDRALAAATAAAPYGHAKLATTDSAAPAASVPKFDYSAVIEHTSDPNVAMAAYLKLVDGGGIVNSAAPPAPVTERQPVATRLASPPPQVSTPPAPAPTPRRRTLADVILDAPSEPPAHEPAPISRGLQDWSRTPGRNRSMS